LGAARWVGEKPNIINVAVSGAKYRVGVIGGYDLWCGIPHVQVVGRMLKNAVVANARATSAEPNSVKGISL
jgi:hypothetical protein